MWERRADTARKRVSMRQLESQRVCEKFLKLELEHNTEACLRLNVVMLQLLVQQLLLCWLLCCYELHRSVGIRHDVVMLQVLIL